MPSTQIEEAARKILQELSALPSLTEKRLLPVIVAILETAADVALQAETIGHSKAIEDAAHTLEERALELAETAQWFRLSGGECYHGRPEALTHQPANHDAVEYKAFLDAAARVRLLFLFEACLIGRAMTKSTGGHDEKRRTR